MENENSLHLIPGNLRRQVNTFEARSLRLMFSRNVSSPLLTGNKIEGEGGISINLTLVDGLKGDVKSGPEATAKVEILALRGDCVGHEGCNGKLEDFNNRIVTKMEGKRSIFQGTTTLKLKEGISSIDDLSFTQSSCWTKISKLCLGARAVDSFPGTTIEPAETESFDLKDNRTTSYAKKNIPLLSDKVSRINCIGKVATKRLNDVEVKTVKDLLVLLNTNPQRLHKILNFNSKALEGVTDHAKTCIIDEAKVYMYIDPNSQQMCGVVYDVIRQVKGLIKEYQYFPFHRLSDNEKKNAKNLVVRALGQGEKVSTYNDLNSLMECFPLALESAVKGNSNQFISWDSPLFDTWEQAGSPPYNICINCIGKSSPMRSHEQGLCSPTYSISHYEEEFLNLVTFNNQRERKSKLKLSWFIICVSRFFVMKKRVGTSVNKRQKIS
ncbi:hypothetical protein DCAR_0518859 [Daucus carota subsp. sativus]|uniref:Uncharacterized protein n=1 Tax=Daucus carota subsp. sativus TaxID=79200 RepID=A0A164XJG1_DAUCS|nr:PREDICTED: calmodulin-binding protein 60 A-like isoform X2 [Daucus carota subsp. sativus]WOG99506.1 hypothetical protein DCAR_0518859 [Daucus carota subsp. sativus]